MPTVPRYDGPQVRDAGPAQPYARTPDTGANLRAVAGGLNQLSQTVDAIVQRDEEIATSKADAAITGGWLAKDAELRKQYQGANVDQYQAEAQKWWKDAANAYGKELSEQGKATLGRVLTRRQAVALGGVAQHVNSEKERTADQAAQANIETSIQFGVTSGDLAGAAARVRQLTAEVGARKGWTTEQVLAEQGKSLSMLHLAQLSKLAEFNATAAQAYYDANKAEVGFAQQPRVEQILKGATDSQFAVQFAASVAAKPLAEQITAAAEIKDPERREKAITQIKTNHGLVLAAKQEQERQFSDQAWQLVGQGKRVPEAILAGMDGRERVQLQDHLRQRAEHLAALGNKPVPTNPNTHAMLWEMLVRNPERFKDERLQAYSTKISQTDLEQLYAKQRELLDPKQSADGVTWLRRIDDRWNMLGIEKDDKKKGTFSEAANREREAFKQRTGKYPTPDEETKLLDRLMLPGQSSWFNDNAKTYAESVVTGRKFVPEISSADRAELVKRFKARGVSAPTDDQIAQAFKAWKGLE
jgi:hypothetical protein